MGPQFTFVDLFAGIGGFRLGLEAAGGRCVYSLERDQFCRKTYGVWFGSEPEGRDINDAEPSEVPPHHIMAAGFPCPAFSRAGVSTRNSLGRPHGFGCKKQGALFFRLVDILDMCRPPALIFENVKNLKSHDSGRTWLTVQDTLGKLGYSVHAEVLDARDFGVPQRRERVLIVGFDMRRVPSPMFLFPEPAERVPLRSILEDNPPADTVLTDRLWGWLRAHRAKHETAGHGFGYRLADPDGASRTLSARYAKDGSEILIPRGNGNPRRLSRREAARLMGFPDHLPIDVVSRTQTYKQFGNAVVPGIVEAVGRQVARSLNAAGVLASP